MIIGDVKDRMAKKSKKEQKRTSGIVIGIVIAVIIIGIIILASNSTKENCRDVQVPYEEEETYWDKESYTEIECNQKELSYTKEITLCDLDVGFLKIGYANVECKIENIDSEEGTFNIAVGFKCDENEWACYTTSSDKFIPSKYSSTIKGSYQAVTMDLKRCFCEVTPPTKQVCEDVTKYRDVQKTRTITKYRTERVCE